MTLGESLSLQILSECYDLEQLQAEQALPVPEPEHDRYSNGVNREP